MKGRFSLFTIHFSLMLTALLLQGCQSYTIVQRNVFSDEDGSQLTVEYGRSESEHVNTFRSPMTGKEMEFKSKLVVKVTFDDQVPDFLEVVNRGTLTNRIELAGESFKAWQCMNFLKTGTMYKTDDEEWMVLVNGFSSMVYHQTEVDPTRYLEVYRGVLCDTPKMDVEKDDRWKVIKKQLQK